MYLYGASGHAKVIIDILEANNIEIVGLFDDNENIKRLQDYEVFIADAVKGPLIVSIGNNKIRHRIVSSLDVEFGKAVHPTAIVSGKATIGNGTVVMQGAVIQSSSTIGQHVIINTGSTIDHDCEIGDFVHIAPGCNLCGNVTIGEGAMLGAGSIVIPGVKVGKWCVIGAGSVVTKDIPDRALASGNRCRVIKSIK